MTAGLTPYPEVKDSGVPWLGDVPRQWDIRRLRSVAEMRVSSVDKHTTQGELPVRLCNYVDVYKNDRITNRITFMRATALPEAVERYRLQVGDVLITKDSETWNDIGVPSLVEYTADDLVSGYHLALLRARRDLLSGAYLHRALQARPIAYQFHVSANGVTRYGLQHGAIKSLVIPVPPLDAQAAIVRFLDHADRRIRRYIRAKQQLIKLLEEQKQTIIHQAVTRGLNPNVRFKPSGVEWLGMVPEHWKVLPLARLLSSRPRNGISAPVVEDGGVLSMSIAAIRNGTVNIAGNEKYIRVDPRRAEQYGLRRGDILVVRGNGNLSLVAKAGVIVDVPGHATYPDILIKLVPNELIKPNLMVLALNAKYVEEQVARSAKTTNGTYKISGASLSRLLLAVPPKEEQSLILEHVSRAAEWMNAMTAAIKRQVGCLLDFRTRLIADVVTGKFDVREAAAKLPDDVAEDDVAADEAFSDDLAAVDEIEDALEEAEA